MRFASLVGIGLVLLADQAMAAILTPDVTAPAFWNDHSVVFGELETVEKLAKGQFSKGTHRICFRPMATLSGTFDPGLHPKIYLHLWVGALTSSIKSISIPEESKKQPVILVIQKRNETYLVTPSIIRFMPDGAAFVPVSSFDDPKVEKTLSAIQEIRKHEKKEQRKGQK